MALNRLWLATATVVARYECLLWRATNIAGKVRVCDRIIIIASMVFVVCKIPSTEGKVLKNWFAKSVSDTGSLRELFDEFAAGDLDSSQESIDAEFNNGVVIVKIGRNRQEDGVVVGAEERLGTVIGALGMYVNFSVRKSAEPPTETPKADAFQLLMAAARSTTNLPPPQWNEINSKAKLKNALLGMLAENDLGWSADNVGHLGVQFVNALSDVLWYIDGNHLTITSRGYEIPLCFQKFQGYNIPEKKKKRKIDKSVLTSRELAVYSTCLIQINSQGYMKTEKWSSMRGFICTLATSLHNYSVYQASKNRSAEALQAKTPRLQNERETWEILPAAQYSAIPGKMAKYSAIHEALEKSSPYEPICLNDFAPTEVWKRHIFLNELVVPLKCVKYTYSTGRGNLTFLWSFPAGHDEEKVLTENMRVRDNLASRLPIFHTRAMRREFIHSFGSVTGTKSLFLREMYRRLTGDSSAARTGNEAEIDKRVAELIETQDPDLIVDLRVNNEGRQEEYKEFLTECKRYIEGTIETAVSDRRHDQVDDNLTVITHLATALSAEDLHRQVVARVPEGTKIPSVQWLRIQFWPRRINAATARYYSGKLKVKYMVQARQFRNNHEDCHYASALFRYEKEFALKYKSNLEFVCMDDKHSIKVGEPGHPLAAVERGKSVIVGLNQRFEVGDHDFSKITLIPSVTLKVDVPDTIDGSWYHGQVFVGLKEHRFEPSSALRHATELGMKVLTDGSNKPILAIYTDGGPDHKVNQLSVQMALICLSFSEIWIC